MRQEDYISELNSQLLATFQEPDGTKVPFYRKSSLDELSKEKAALSRLIQEGNLKGYISDSDFKEMAPSGARAGVGEKHRHRPSCNSASWSLQAGRVGLCNIPPTKLAAPGSLPGRSATPVLSGPSAA